MSYEKIAIEVASIIDEAEEEKIFSQVVEFMQNLKAIGEKHTRVVEQGLELAEDAIRERDTNGSIAKHKQMHWAARLVKQVFDRGLCLYHHKSHKSKHNSIHTKATRLLKYCSLSSILVASLFFRFVRLIQATSLYSISSIKKRLYMVKCNYNYIDYNMKGQYMTTHELTKTQEEATEAKEPTFTEETVKEPLIDLRITEDGKVSHFKVIKKFRHSSKDNSVKYRYELFMNGKSIDHYYCNDGSGYNTDEISKGFNKIYEVRDKIHVAISQIEKAKETLATYLPEALDTVKGQEQAQVI